MDALAADADLYERDFFSWTARQAALIRDGRLDDIDRENVAEEIESMGRSQAASLESAYRLICLHQLKRMLQPERDGRSWSLTIGRERLRAARLLRQNPGLKPRRSELFANAYSDARAEASLPAGRFPEEPPFTLQEIEDVDFWAGPI